MLQVIRGFICSDSVALAKWLLEQSKSGNSRGMAVCVRNANGNEEFLFTGSFRSHPESAIGAVARMYWAAACRAMPPGKENR